MGAIRSCCGYYCAFIMFIGIFFFILTIILELTKNQYTLFKLQEFDFEKENGEKVKWDQAKQQADDKVNDRVISMAIAIAINFVCIFFCIGCVRIGAKKEVQEDEQQQLII
ncbi:UNKNOWN [Stylonychia lemnae]|uniref:Uncharacterized protein n=1 Tax=Stylonychia lemnae TaxID=5949 RepID=A0A078A0G9_STYLE|nr:UNKNOWN [Stylonychia lemnae]|eukprot:CDW74278.1 UNKNOWN [Stylonychia lemnae]